MTDATKTATHTPGPWIVRSYIDMQHPSCLGDDDNRHMIISEGGQGLAHTVGLNTETDVVNARLIAAAPDLLAACKATLPPLEQRQPWHVMLEAAIAKAEGGGV